MEYKSGNKICQNCKRDFVIESEDFKFYEKVKVPPPTFCSECRRMRRFVWRNERSLYRRACDLCKKNIISIYHDKVSFPVYCKECWHGDDWDAFSYAKEYNLSRSFFEQYKELSLCVPRLAIWQRNAVNSEYSGMVAESKNVYLSASVTKGSENIFYSKSIDNSKDILDSLNIKGGENLYENVEGDGNYNSQYLLLCRSTIDSYYSVDCVNCSNCFLSYNLRNKSYCIGNKQYSREEYLKEIKKFDLKSKVVRGGLSKEYNDIKRNAVYRFANILRSMDSTGNNLLNVKDCIQCFDLYDAENLRYCYRGYGFNDCMDFDYGLKSELVYEYTTGATNDNNIRFSYNADSVRDADYTDSCKNSSNLFGAIGVRNSEYVILNKVYSREKYLELRDKIIKSMNEAPYVDQGGRIYQYGEFFPIELAPFAYNETIAQELVPLTEEEAVEKGYPWFTPSIKNFEISIRPGEIPDSIEDVDEGILEQVLGCAHEGKCNHQCSTAFRISPYELTFYKKHNIPLPALCSNCRYYERIKDLPALKLWRRRCMNEDCSNEFKTAYAPERPEKVYCESCYNKEVY